VCDPPKFTPKKWTERKGSGESGTPAHQKHKHFKKLNSRKRKGELHEIMVATPDQANKTNYTTYRNIYNRLVRAAKKKYFHDKINANSGNPKKIWETLSEALEKKQKTEQISKINTGEGLTTDPKSIATEFNRFFTSVGAEISESILPVAANPEDLVSYDHDFPDFAFNNVTPEYVVKILKTFTAKSSGDIDGVSTKFL
jgi:hypothetical protein